MSGSALPPEVVDRLVKLLGMIGSDHDGEALNAARLADKLVREAGLTWAEVFSEGSPKTKRISVDPGEIVEEIVEIYKSCIHLRSRDISFLNGIEGHYYLSEKQLAWLHDLLERARAKMAKPPPPPPKPRKTRAPRKSKSEPKPPAGDAGPRVDPDAPLTEPAPS